MVRSQSIADPKNHSCGKLFTRLANAHRLRQATPVRNGAGNITAAGKNKVSACQSLMKAAKHSKPKSVAGPASNQADQWPRRAGINPSKAKMKASPFGIP